MFKKIIGAVLYRVSGGRIVTKQAAKDLERIRKSWEMKCERMQWELNQDHAKRLGWMVNANHELVKFW